MGIFDTYIGLRDKWPVRAIETLVIDSAKPVWGRIIGASLTAEEIEMRIYRLPVVKAEIGAVALQQGREDEDTQLQHLGAAMVIQAAVDAAGKQNDFVVQTEVSDVAATLKIGDVTQNPYVSNDMVQKADPILNIPGGTSIQ